MVDRAANDKYSKHRRRLLSGRGGGLTMLYCRCCWRSHGFRALVVSAVNIQASRLLHS
jgi:hypothetical protein